MTLNQPTPAEIFALSTKVAALLRALLYHPGTAYVDGDDKITDPPNTNPTLYYVTDFVQNTYLNYLLPLLPPSATKNCRALANPWAYKKSIFTEDQAAMSEDKYPVLTGNGVRAKDLREKWMDANMRSIMTGSIILDPSKQMLFGGSFDFEEDVYQCARDLRGGATH